MWSESDGERELQEYEDGRGRPSNGSEVVMMNERALASAAPMVPNISQFNVTKPFANIQIGPRYITQNVHHSEVIQDLSCPKYVWNVIKNTTRAEKLTCAIALVFLMLCVTLILVFTLPNAEVVDTLDIAPHPWNETRDLWLAEAGNETETTKPYEPLHLVVIQHTVGPECHKFITCAAEIRNLQNYFLKTYDYDIPYNFMIGNDGRLYEGRGFGLVGAHTIGYNRCSLGIGFIGDYREEMTTYAKVTPLQVENVQRLLNEGVRSGYLHPNYHVVGARDVHESSQSPGSNLYREIQRWPHYDHKGLYRNKTCPEIRAMYDTL